MQVEIYDPSRYEYSKTIQVYWKNHEVYQWNKIITFLRLLYIYVINMHRKQYIFKVINECMYKKDWKTNI